MRNPLPSPLPPHQSLGFPGSHGLRDVRRCAFLRQSACPDVASIANSEATVITACGLKQIAARLDCPFGTFVLQAKRPTLGGILPPRCFLLTACASTHKFTSYYSLRAAEMSELDDVFEVVAAYFAMLSEPTRVKIIHAICQKEKSVSEIVDELGATQTNVSRHLGLMFRSGVVAKRKEGNQVFYRISDQAMVEICRTVCIQIAGQIDEQQPLRRGLLKLVPSRRSNAA